MYKTIYQFFLQVFANVESDWLIEHLDAVVNGFSLAILSITLLALIAVTWWVLRVVLDWRSR